MIEVAVSVPDQPEMAVLGFISLTGDPPQMGLDQILDIGEKVVGCPDGMRDVADVARS